MSVIYYSSNFLTLVGGNIIILALAAATVCFIILPATIRMRWNSCASLDEGVSNDDVHLAERVAET